jgi:hypothetical protein
VIRNALLRSDAFRGGVSRNIVVIVAVRIWDLFWLGEILNRDVLLLENVAGGMMHGATVIRVAIEVRSFPLYMHAPRPA